MCRKMEVSRVGPEGEKTPLSSLSGGEKVIIQMCLIFALWTVSRSAIIGTHLIPTEPIPTYLTH
jgi:hypothetical protein